MTLSEPARGRAWLATIGLAVLFLTSLGAPSLRFLGDNAFMGLALAAGMLALLATRLVDRLPDDRTSLMIIFGIGIALRVVVLAHPPLLSDDIYRYVWDGRVQAAGINPYRYVPADPALAGLRDGAIYPFINRADYAVTIYPPVAQAFFLVVTRVSESVFGMRLALILCEGVTVAAVLALLRLTRRPSLRVVAYAWHPLPIWEVANNGHVDALMTALMMVGLWLALARRRPLSGAAAVALGALAKPFALLALPPLWRPWNWRMLLTVAAMMALPYAPYLSVGRGVIGFLASGYLGEQRLDTGGGFWVLRVWRSLFGILPGDSFVYIGLAAVLLVGFALRSGFRRERNEAVTLRDVASLLVVFFVLLSPDFPWYFLPVVPFLALVGGPAAWALTVGGFLLNDVVPGDVQVPFFVRAGVFNVLVVTAALLRWYFRRAKISDQPEARPTAETFRRGSG